MTTDGNSGRSYFIAGIGASAGGLEALQRFLTELPPDFGFSLVFVQHLSAKHKSLLPELLAARRPSLVIQEISDGLKVEPGRLYLAPPGREVRLRNGLFQTTVHAEGLIHLPIDEFLGSLAEDAGDHSIAVVFSGAGTDGARGCQAVRSVGGTVFVQDPRTAEFDSMPLAAIATGQADAVLSPEEIAAELLKLQVIGQSAIQRENPLTPEEQEDFFRIIQEKTGSRFNYYKKNVVSRRIRRRMYLHGLSAIKEYRDLISTNDSEAESLASDLMIGVTSFFRDRVAWKALKLEAVRKIASENTDLPARVWTPASATGEEAYSIAMMLLREIALAGKKREVQVFATDLNDRALERAREGRYPASITADVPQEYLEKFFTSTDDGNFLVINKDVRESVVFAKQDLLIDPPFSKLDLIICRNFMIYLEPKAQEKCIRLFHYALKNGGYLFLGNAETVGRKSDLFKSIGHKQCRVYRKLETKPASRLPISVPYAAERQALAKQAQTTEQGRSVIEIIQEKLIEEYGPASVAIDQNYEIIYHNGPTNRYLCQPRGVPTQNLLELVPENLRSRIRGALYRSGREDKPVAVRTSMAGDDNKPRHVVLRIAKAAENISIVVFQEKRAPSKKEVAEQVEATVIEETAIHQLENELSATRADLQSHIEQLKSMNEEFQSSNEELQAANEELETSREELQSLNEELITVNAQLQGKIEEQDLTNNDLNNFLASTNIPTIFLDQQFKVKRFTPAILKLIKLLPSDVGRPIVDMSQENLGPDLIPDAHAVLEQLVPLRREIEINDTWYVRTTLPYRTADNRIEGVVITYNDVSELKKTEERTKHLASFPELNPNPICEVHSSGKISFCNPATEKVLADFGIDTKDVTVFLPEDMDDILRDLGKKEEASLYRERVIKDRVFGMTVHLAPQFNVVRIYAYDITERKRAEDASKESEQRFRLLFENMLHGFAYCKMIYDNDGKPEDFVYLDVNSAFGKLTGLENVVGKKVSEVIPGTKESHPELFETYGRVARTGRPEIFEIEFKPLRIWFSISVYSTQKDHFVAIFDNITERKHAEEALRQSEERLRYHVENSPLAVVEWDADFLVTRWAGEAEEIFGWSAAETVGKAIMDLRMIFEEDIPIVQKTMEKLTDGVSRHVVSTNRNYKKDGSVIHCTWYNTVLLDAAGKMKSVMSQVMDITERKRAEDALRESEERFRSLVEQAVDGIFMADAQGRYIDVNTAGARMLGYTREEVCQLSVTDVISPADLAHMPGQMSALASGSVTKNEWQFCRKDGSTFTGEVVGRQLPDGRLLGILRDITERKAAEEALRNRTDELETINKELEAFIYSVSHDLRAPLRTMSGFSKILIEDYGDKLEDQPKDYLTRITNASEKMTELIDDLLRLSRISKRGMDRIDYDLSKMVFTIAAGLREAEPGRNVDVAIAEDLRASVDPNLIRVALMNLVENAWKFTSKTVNARIEFGTFNNDETTVYFLKDNGAGFDQTYADKMFRPFQRLHTEKEFEGTGIGLAIVERIIRRHGGAVWAEGQVGKGATVFFTLGARSKDSSLVQS